MNHKNLQNTISRSKLIPCFSFPNMVIQICQIAFKLQRILYCGRTPHLQVESSTSVVQQNHDKQEFLVYAKTTQEELSQHCLLTPCRKTVTQDDSCVSFQSQESRPLLKIYCLTSTTLTGVLKADFFICASPPDSVACTLSQECNHYPLE